MVLHYVSNGLLTYNSGLFIFVDTGKVRCGSDGVLKRASTRKGSWATDIPRDGSARKSHLVPFGNIRVIFIMPIPVFRKHLFLPHGTLSKSPMRQRAFLSIMICGIQECKGKDSLEFPGSWYSKGFGKVPMVLLTNCPVNLKNKETLWGIVEIYLTRLVILKSLRKNSIKDQKQTSPYSFREAHFMTKQLFETGKWCLIFLCLTLVSLQSFAGQPTYPIAPEVYTTRQQTVRPAAIPGAAELTITQVDQYAPEGYSNWVFGAPVDYGFLLPDGTAAGAQTPVEQLLNFFAISDIHITDKESPGEPFYPGTVSPFGNVNTSGYSPVVLSTTHVLDAAVQTINALHAAKTPAFDFGMSLGDAANNTQYNELRWFIDTIDGKRINPSSGAHEGATFIDYQKPYQAAGLDKTIPWYQVIGNHDQWWCGTLAYTDYVRSILVSNTVLNIGLIGSGLSAFPTFDSRGFYMGTVDGTTPYGDVIDAGPEETMAPPIIAADKNRRSLTTSASTTLNWMKEFFNTTTSPRVMVSPGQTWTAILHPTHSSPRQTYR